MATMEDHSSRWFDVQSVPLSYTFPPENRPGKLPFSTCTAIPIINLNSPEKLDTTQKIIKAGQNFGVFQVFFCFLWLLNEDLLKMDRVVDSKFVIWYDSYWNCRWLTMEFQKVYQLRHLMCWRNYSICQWRKFQGMPLKMVGCIWAAPVLPLMVFICGGITLNTHVNPWKNACNVGLKFQLGTGDVSKFPSNPKKIYFSSKKCF